MISRKASGSKLFIDDLREIVHLAQVESGRTVSDVIRDLVHEALVTRRQRSIGRDEDENYLRGLHQKAISAGIDPLASELKLIKQTLDKLAPNGQVPTGSIEEKLGRFHSLLIEILGFTMAAEMKAHIQLQNYLLGRGLTEEAVKKLLAEHDEKSRRRTEKIVTGLIRQ
jgi:hypothetical protein